MSVRSCDLVRAFVPPLSVLAVGAIALLGSPRTALAEGCFTSFDSFVGGGIGVSPEFLGSDEYEATPFFDACVDFGERYIEVLGTRARGQILNHRNFHAGPVVLYRVGRESEEVDDPVIALLPEVEDTFEVGAFLEIREQDILGPQDSLALRIEGTQDVSDGHDGFQAELALIYRRKWNRHIESASKISGAFNSANFADSFFTVTPADAGASGLAPFQASDGVQDIGTLNSVTWHFAERWSVTGNVDAKYLLGDANDSPIVDVQGDAFQVTAGATINFKFWRDRN